MNRGRILGQSLSRESALDACAQGSGKREKEVHWLSWARENETMKMKLNVIAREYHPNKVQDFAANDINF